MKLIPLEEVIKILQPHVEHSPQGEHNLWLFSWVTIAIHSIKEIPTIDPIATIDEMIEEILPISSFWTSSSNWSKIDALQELKYRLLLTQK